MPNLRPLLDLWRQNEFGSGLNLGVVSVLDFESQLALQAKGGNVKLTFLTVSLEKCDFFQTTLNIDIFYTIGNHFHHEYGFEIVTSK